jgi:hypothetical protein
MIGRKGYLVSAKSGYLGASLRLCVETLIISVLS